MQLHKPFGNKLSQTGYQLVMTPSSQYQYDDEISPERIGYK